MLVDLAPGDVVRYSDIARVHTRRVCHIEHIAEVLSRAGLLTDDRPNTFAEWLKRSLAEIPKNIAADLADWVNAMVEGGPRTKRRSPATAANYLRLVRPSMIIWASRYDHLRQVTRQDVAEALGRLHGEKAASTITALRSLFRYCKVTGLIFNNPTAGIRGPDRPLLLRQPLDPARLTDLTETLSSETQRLIVALAAIHAARVKTIRQMQLTDVDLGEQRIMIDGVARPMGHITYALLTQYFRFRQDRWPNTANKHLIISMHTAHGTGPASGAWLNKMFRGTGVTLEALRLDRLLEEALTRGPDPLHLAAAFGVSQSAAIRYAQVARVLLNTPAELHDGVGAPESSS
ncbi:site-specific integrase [Nonomuraea aurantiaca]|uniref:site-specific integrase n=1 Tax=Nonomuraea aurantiaca TaxID=2878562 RepID=UPI001CD9F0B0|nr:site-specific integrase [Nonomuraea aurantiaca]MCA2230050.1 hypothetical protein [Nonomuraea aurantiaca]